MAMSRMSDGVDWADWAIGDGGCAGVSRALS
jgi:hypothetical protein